ncbi:hypothetical protein CRENBAI_020962 [Crenichthys baileyi]|uniref:Uncharacterized protein n=1 Tax=Crenichthys baileyi TaxID=28760 RepID=A0AAV9RIK7_9TELE
MDPANKQKADALDRWVQRQKEEAMRNLETDLEVLPSPLLLEQMEREAVQRRSPLAPLAAHSGPAVKPSPSSRCKKRQRRAPSFGSAGKEVVSLPADVSRDLLLSSPRQDSRELLLSSPRQDSRALLRSSPSQVSRALLRSRPRQVSRALLRSSPRQGSRALLRSSPRQVSRALLQSSPRQVHSLTHHSLTHQSLTLSLPQPPHAAEDVVRGAPRLKSSGVPAPAHATEGLGDASSPAHATEGLGGASAPAHATEGLGDASAPAYSTEGLGDASASAHATEGLGDASASAHATEGLCNASAAAPSLQAFQGFSGELVPILVPEPCDKGFEEEVPPDPVSEGFK